MKRRKFITTGATASLAGLGSASAADSYVTPMHPTPTEIKGPFYPAVAQK